MRPSWPDPKVRVTWNIHWSCNFRCTFCPTGDYELLKSVSRPLGVMPYELFCKIIDDLKEFPEKLKSLRLYKDGEPFLNKNLIIDEAQNLTPKQMKTQITRAGPGTKVVCMGNIAQIDTPYLTEGSSGLTYVVDRFKGWEHSGHVTLQRGERSRLADHAAEVL